MLLSRSRPVDQNTKEGSNQQQLPKLEEFLVKRDFVGALTLLDFQRSIKREQPLTGGKAIAFCSFHLGDFNRALEEYLKLVKIQEKTEPKATEPKETEVTWLNIACCYFCLGMYTEATEATEKCLNCPLKTRLLFHLAHKSGDEDALIAIHQKLEDTLENQLSLASVHYLRRDYQDAIDIYKKILVNNRDHLALNVYVALCYHRLEYFDVSQEVLSVYLQHHPDSSIAANLRACNTFRLFSGSSAEKDLKPLLNIMQQNEQSKHGNFSTAYDLIRHNLVVFRSGEGSLQILPKLLNVIPEARLNLIIYYLHQEDVTNAFALLKDTKPKTDAEYILFACVNVLLAQQSGNREYLAKAQNYYNRIGSSESQQDSVFGRLCMASAHFLNGNFDHCALYLNSVRTHYHTDDTFNFNYAQACAMDGRYQEAEELLLMIQDEKIRNDFVYVLWLARCYIMNKKPRLAWELYDRMETSQESFRLLQLIGNECYRMGIFYYAAKAFDHLEKFDSSQENWEGKRGACIGVFQLIIAGQEPKESLSDIIAFLRNSSKQGVEKILGIMKKWARDNRILL